MLDFRSFGVAVLMSHTYYTRSLVFAVFFPKCFCLWQIFLVKSFIGGTRCRDIRRAGIGVADRQGDTTAFAGARTPGVCVSFRRF